MVAILILGYIMKKSKQYISGHNKSDHYISGHGMGRQGSAAGLRPEGLTHEQSKEWLDGYRVGVADRMRSLGLLGARSTFQH